MFAKNRPFWSGYTFSVRLISISIEIKMKHPSLLQSTWGLLSNKTFMPGHLCTSRAGGKGGGALLVAQAPPPLILASIEKRNKDWQFINGVTPPPISLTFHRPWRQSWTVNKWDANMLLNEKKWKIETVWIGRILIINYYYLRI